MENNSVIIYYCIWDGKNGSHDLLKRAAVHWCSCHNFMRETDLKQLFQVCQADKWKKPYFEEPKGVKFSISHSGNLWMCAISDQEVGLDVQEENSCKRERVARRFFHPQETEWLSGQDYRDFFRVWAAKESYVKYIGDGLVYGMEKFCVVNEQGLSDGVEGVWQQHFLMKLSENGMLEDCNEPGADALAVCLTTAKEMEGSVDFLSLQNLKIV